MIRVTAPARLHFGLLSLPAEGEDRWPDRHGEPALPARRFGGAGLMVEGPPVRLRVEPAADWSAEGPLADRALVFAHRFAGTVAPESLTPRRIVVEAAPPEHRGFGAGTQLGLAVARALAVAAGRPTLAVAELAHRVGRGLRSALGVHGFAGGGFLVEPGKRSGEGVSPLLVRQPFPEAWRVVIAVPGAEPGLHGAREREAFRELFDRPCPVATTDALCRLVLLGMLPALVEEDVDDFGEALHDFNARVGEAFAPIQGGTYAGRRVAEVVDFLRRQGVRGVGQSSWGPAVFAVVGDQERADDLARRLGRQLGPGSPVFVTRGCNRGAETCTGQDASGPQP
jgi:beta-ribofuranosylaminobenzene 5'-phosphate synthase